MSTLTFREKRLLEGILGMETGYVLDFSNRTFAEFFSDVVDRNIYSQKYDYASGSKANRLRRFWEVEDDETVAEVLEELVALAEEEEDASPRRLQKAWKIVERLRGPSDTPAVAPVRRTPEPVHETYEVALSFAGEQRNFVREVAGVLKANDVTVFFDEEEDLWGKDLAVELSEVYGRRSRFVVIFVSKEYVQKSWTRHERQAALSGRLERRDDSVLPAKFDDTALPGLPSTIGYLDVRGVDAKTVAKRILRKLRRHPG